MKTHVVIMAAGMGSRYGGLKQIDRFGPLGETILEYSIYDAIRAGFDKVILVIRDSFHDEFKRVLGNRFSDKIEVAYVYQEVNPIVPGFENLPERSKPWGTGHAVISAKDAIDGPFCVINADDWYGRDAFQQMYQYLTSTLSPNTCAMVGYMLKNTLSNHGTVNRGICALDTTHALVSIEEHLKIARNNQGIAESEQGVTFVDDTIVSMNFWGFHSSMLDLFDSCFHAFLKDHGHEEGAEFYITTPPDIFVHEADKRCDVMISKDTWHGVTYADDKPLVQQAIQSYVKDAIYPENLWS